MFDGDLIFSTDNKVLVDKWRDERVVLCAQKKGEKKVPTEQDFIDSNINGFGDDIGKVTNRITTMFDVQSKYEPESDEYKELTYRIIAGQKFQQDCIDRIKGIKASPMPKYWYDNKACAISEDDNPDVVEDKRFWSRICAHRKPYFMSYIYPAQMRDYKKYVAAARKRIEWDGYSGLDEIMQKDVKDEYDETVIQYYLYRMPVGVNSCTMNRLCWIIEDEMEKHMTELKIHRVFDYDSLKSGESYKNSQYYGIRPIFEDYLKYASGNSVIDNSTMKNKETSDDRTEKLAMYNESMLRHLHEKCSDDNVLCDILLDMCKKNSSSVSIVWALFPDVIINRLLKKSKNKVHALVKQDDGNIEYCGEHYNDVIVDMSDNEKEGADGSSAE